MTAGVHRTDTAYVLPEALVRPPDGLRLVYLDLNHWIYLAKAATGRADGARFRDALEALRAARGSGRFNFPLSMAHYAEMAGIMDPRQRSDVASVMEELSSFVTLVDRVLVMRLELEAVIDALARPRPEPYAMIPVIGRGAAYAFGRVGRLIIRSSEDGRDMTEHVRSAHPSGPEAFDRLIADAQLMLERAVLRGPTDEEVPKLRALGWDPTTSRRVNDKRAKQEEEQAARLAAEPRWRRGRLRDVVACRYVALEVYDMLKEALAARDLGLADVWRDIDTARRLVDSMPGADVWVSLLTARHRNPQTRWLRNHIVDADALSVAVPYCDIVLADNESRHLLTASGVPARLGTEMPANLRELGDMLAQGF